MDNEPLFDLLDKLPFWQAAIVFVVFKTTTFLTRIYNDSGKEYLANYFTLKLNLYRNRLSEDLTNEVIAGAYSRIELEIISEVVKVFDINDRDSQERKKQIPVELREAAGRGISSVLPRLIQFRSARTGKPLSLAIDNIRLPNFSAKLWSPILEITLNDTSKYARTAAILAVREQIANAREVAIEIINSKRENDTNTIK